MSRKIIPILPVRMPYQKDISDNFDIQYERYLEDFDRKIAINGRVYYKIIQICIFYGKKLLVTLDIEIDLCIGDMLTDEKGNIYTAESFEMLNFGPRKFTDWHTKTCCVVLNGELKIIGNYITKIFTERSTYN